MLLCHPGKPWLRAFGHRIARCKVISPQNHTEGTEGTVPAGSQAGILSWVAFLLDDEVIPTQHDFLITVQARSTLPLPYRSSAKVRALLLALPPGEGFRQAALPVLPACCRGAIPSSPTQECNLWGRLDRTDNLGAAITHLWGRRHRDLIGSASNKDRERHVGASRDGPGSCSDLTDRGLQNAGKTRKIRGFDKIAGLVDAGLQSGIRNGHGAAAGDVKGNSTKLLVLPSKGGLMPVR